MQVSVENGEGLERRMTVGLESERIDVEVEKRLREIARSSMMRGFRPGKVPLKVLRRCFGEQVLQAVFGELVKESFAEAVAKEDLLPAGAPQIEPDIDESAKRYTYTAVFEVFPQFELGALEGKTLKRPVAEVTDADLEGMLMRLREQNKTWRSVERPAQSGDRLSLSYNGILDGEPLDGGSARDAKIELGLGRMIPGFEDGLVGVHAGEERHLDLQFPEAYPAEQLRGRPVTFDVRVDEVAEPVIPELDADFAEALGIADGDLDRFRSDVRWNMERELKKRIDAKIKGQAMDLLVETNPIELPEVLVEEEIDALEQQARQTIQRGNLEFPDNLFRDQARRRVALGLILRKVVKANGIKVDPDRVREVVEDMASTYEHPQQFIDSYHANKDHRARVESLTLGSQVVDWVMGQVTVEDEPTTFDALTALADGR